MRDLRKVLGYDVYAYIARLRRQGTIVVRDNIVSLNSSFVETARLYERELEKLARKEQTTALA